MRCACGHVSIELPDELEDQTSYNLDEEGASEPDRVELRFEALPIEVLPADVIADVRERMANVRSGTWSFTEGDATAGPTGTQARTLHAKLEIEGAGMDILVGAFRREGDIVTLRYETRRRPDPDAILAHALGSVADVSHEAHQVTLADGYERRALGRISLELPRELSYPQTYLFRTHDEGTTLVVTSERGDAVSPDPVADAPTFDLWLRHLPGETLAVTQLSGSERAAGELALSEGTWRVDQRAADGTARSTGFRQVLVRWPASSPPAHPTPKPPAQLRVRVLLVEAQGPAFGDRCWPAIAASVQPTARTA